MHDLAIITVSTNESHWIRKLLPTVFAHLGDITADVIVVDNDSHDGIADMVADEFNHARTVLSANHGFGHANNRGLITCNARYVLFLNPDTEILEGTFAELVRMMDERPNVGLVGCRQMMAGKARLDVTIRYFPTALRALGDACRAERLGRRRPRWLGEREMNPDAYEREFACDWVTGSFMLVRRETLESAGCFDERFFMSSEETDLCRRIKTSGWEIRHLPQMTILHHDGKAGVKPNMESLYGFTRMLYARKYFSTGHRLLYGTVVTLRHLLRAMYSGSGDLARQRRAASRQVLATLFKRRPVPFDAITNRVAVATADQELRAAHEFGSAFPEADPVAR